jgi:histidyl-tRNA synthetase
LGNGKSAVIDAPRVGGESPGEKARHAGGKSPAAERLRIILDAIEELGLQDGLVLDPSITRGLDYYTGVVFETFLNDLPSLGSVCSGGRYDNLTGLFMKEPVSGVGASIGLDRLMAGLEELGRLESSESNTDVLILLMDEGLLARYQRWARELRNDGLSVEVYPELKKLSVQFKYAESRGIPVALIAGAEEAAGNKVNLKDLRSRESFNALGFEEARMKVKEMVSRN